MLVQALAEYADRELAAELGDESWEEKPVPYLIEIDREGTFLNLTARFTVVPRGKKTMELALPLMVPRSPVPRNAGLYPLLAADDIKYVLGVGSWTKAGQQANHEERYRAFIELIGKAARETSDEGLLAVKKFYDRPDQVDNARRALANTQANPVIALSVGGPVVGRPAVQEYWRKHYLSASTQRVAKGGHGECLISGRLGPIAPTHEKIKGLSGLGGQGAGVALMSFDKEAFCSYGWQQNANSPVAPDRAMAYVLALNDLLRHDHGHRRDHAGVAFIFWTKEKTEFDPMSNVEHADEVQVSKLLQLDPLASPDPNMFYMAGLGANGGRLLIRYWVSETLATVKANQKGWFEGLRIANSNRFPKLWELQAAIHREGKPPKDRVLALVRRAIEGSSQPLGYDILSAALNRVRASGEKRSEPVRMGLIRLCLNDLLKHKGEYMTAELDTGQRHEAYLCGRLLAVYESLQSAAYRSAGEREVNQTVADRYYALASTYPALAFPKLEQLGQKHLRKLRRPEGRGIAVNIEKEIDHLHLAIEEAAGFRFPAGLDPVGQGRFALGYHHQRARHFDQARSRKAQATIQENQPE